jgi:hypothetical protein
MNPDTFSHQQGEQSWESSLVVSVTLTILAARQFTSPIKGS